VAVLTALALGGMATMIGTAPSVAADPCSAPPNEIVAENCKPGTPFSVWNIPGAGDSSIQGYATDISVDQSQRVDFKVSTASSDYRLDIYRMGYYGGDGARKVATVQPSVALPQGQPDCATDSSTGLVQCASWAVSAAWTVPGDAVSGIYFAHLVREDGPSGESHIFFVVRDDDGRSDLLFQTSDTTWQAYNAFGGSSLYTNGPGSSPLGDYAYKVSYDRPFTTRDNAPEDWVFNAEYPMVRWLERNGYDVSYFSGVDSDRLGAELREHRAFLSVGHDEYWSATQRANVTAARDAGVNLAFFSGNEVFWKTRWENNHRTLVAYKETHAGRRIDPTGTWTGTWRDPRFSPPADGGQPENALTGQLFTVNGPGTTDMEVPAAEGKLRFWRHTGIANLAPGQIAVLPEGTLGYEWDEDVDNGFRPPGSFRVSSTTRHNMPVLQDFGSNYASGTAVHNMTLYRAPSGARVFGAGTVQWSWGLDSSHDRGAAPADARMQQATANLFADMGAQGATLQSELTGPSCSSDATGPTTQITLQGPGIAQGTAADSGGGRVAGVEVSIDGGSTWHLAEGRESWRYTWSPASAGNVRARAVDDSGNLGPGQSHATPATCGGGGPLSGGGSQGGGGTPSGSGGTSGSKPRPRPRAFITARRVRVSRDGLVTLRIKCSGGKTACRVRLRLQRGGRKLVGRRVVISAGAPRPVRLFLSRSVRRKLALKGALRVTAVVSVPDGAGHRTVTRAPIRLLASRGR
jgi:hypothetical protein